jgi:hypothetical protein
MSKDVYGKLVQSNGSIMLPRFKHARLLIQSVNNVSKTFKAVKKDRKVQHELVMPPSINSHESIQNLDNKDILIRPATVAELLQHPTS